MKVIKDKTVYTIEHDTQELKDLWFFFNDYLNKHTNDEDNENYKLARKFHDDYKFVTQ